ncbi:MAG: RluA family pseudouridine synthase [Deltaproteobacteria bacterium]|nr:RluA family pseudouridine synthase [Deltaproteobacteria bacterium]
MKKLTLEAHKADHGERLDRFLAAKGGLTRGEARRLLDRGAVWVNGLRVKIASKPVYKGQQVVVIMEEGGRSEPTEQKLGPERILFEDVHFIAVDKPVGIPAQSTLGSDQGNMVSLVSEHVGRPVGLVHRLDLETSGVTVFGKTRPATVALAKAFAEGTAHKRYLAIAVGELPDEGRIDLAISPDGRRWGKYRALPNGKLTAATRYRVLARQGNVCAVEAFPETGRTHQIRVHLKALGAPIAGDDLYGGPNEIETPAGKMPAARVMLHARSLEVPHPKSGAVVKFQAPVPEDLQALLAALGVDPAKV